MAKTGEPSKRFRDSGPVWFFLKTLAIVVPLLLIVTAVFYVGALAADRHNAQGPGSWWMGNQNNGAAVLSALVAGAFTVLVGVVGAYLAAMSATRHALEQQKKDNLSLEVGKLRANQQVALATETRLAGIRIAGYAQEFTVNDATGGRLSVRPDAIFSIAAELRSLVGLWDQVPALPPPEDAVASGDSTSVVRTRGALIAAMEVFVNATDTLRRDLDIKLDPATNTVEQLVEVWVKSTDDRMDTSEESWRPSSMQEEAKWFLMDALFMGEYIPEGGWTTTDERERWKALNTVQRRIQVAMFLRSDPSILLRPKERREWLIGLAARMGEWLPAIAAWLQTLAYEELSMRERSTVAPAVSVTPDRVLDAWERYLQSRWRAQVIPRPTQEPPTAAVNLGPTAADPPDTD